MSVVIDQRARLLALLTRLESVSVELRREVERVAGDIRSDSKNALLRHLRGAECAAAVERQRIERGCST